MFLDIRTEDRAGGETAFLEEGLGRGGSGKGRLTVGLPWSRGLCGCGGGRVQAGHCVQRGGGRCGVEGLSRAIGAGCGPGKGRVCESQACRRPAGKCPFHPLCSFKPEAGSPAEAALFWVWSVNNCRMLALHKPPSLHLGAEGS